jgi:cellulose synthase/poly-beta-1,6-N-acetylglucosamine synthase-like glycosyltransferase
MRWRAKGRRLPYVSFSQNGNLPEVAVFIPLHNEEQVLEKKLRSVLSCKYPPELLKVLCGLDECTDQSKSITERISTEFPDRLFFLESDRLGKPEMLNRMVAEFSAYNKILILTDANVIFYPDTVFELVKYFKDKEIGLVDAGFVLNTEVVSHEMEFEYLGMEQQLKYAEGLVWGTMQGPFGGCYAIRGELWETIPGFFGR